MLPQSSRFAKVTDFQVRSSASTGSCQSHANCHSFPVVNSLDEVVTSLCHCTGRFLPSRVPSNSPLLAHKRTHLEGGVHFQGMQIRDEDLSLSRDLCPHLELRFYIGGSTSSGTSVTLRGWPIHVYGSRTYDSKVPTRHVANILLRGRKYQRNKSRRHVICENNLLCLFISPNERTWKPIRMTRRTFNPSEHPRKHRTITLSKCLYTCNQTAYPIRLCLFRG